MVIPEIQYVREGLTGSKQPLVSILIVTYNAEKFIRATVDSCLAQTYQAIEVLIYDNASTDRTLEVLNMIHDLRLSVIRGPKNIGPYAGLNELMAKARGEFYAIQDHDDLWLARKIEAQVAWLSQHPDAIGCGVWTYYYFEGRGLAAIVQRPERSRFVPHTTVVVRATSIRYDPDHPIADQAFEQKIQSQGWLGCVQQSLSIHRIRSDQHNLSRQRRRMNLRGARAYLQLHGVTRLFGSLFFFIGALLPPKIHWWYMRAIAFRKCQWLTQETLERESGLSLG